MLIFRQYDQTGFTRAPDMALHGFGRDGKPLCDFVVAESIETMQQEGMAHDFRQFEQCIQDAIELVLSFSTLGRIVGMRSFGMIMSGCFPMCADVIQVTRAVPHKIEREGENKCARIFDGRRIQPLPSQIGFLHDIFGFIPVHPAMQKTQQFTAQLEK